MKVLCSTLAACAMWVIFMLVITIVLCIWLIPDYAFAESARVKAVKANHFWLALASVSTYEPGSSASKFCWDVRDIADRVYPQAKEAEHIRLQTAAYGDPDRYPGLADQLAFEPFSGGQLNDWFMQRLRAYNVGGLRAVLKPVPPEPEPVVAKLKRLLPPIGLVVAILVLAAVILGPPQTGPVRPVGKTEDGPAPVSDDSISVQT